MVTILLLASPIKSCLCWSERRQIRDAKLTRPRSSNFACLSIVLHGIVPQRTHACTYAQDACRAVVWMDGPVLRRAASCLVKHAPSFVDAVRLSLQPVMRTSAQCHDQVRDRSTTLAAHACQGCGCAVSCACCVVYRARVASLVQAVLPQTLAVPVLHYGTKICASSVKYKTPGRSLCATTVLHAGAAVRRRDALPGLQSAALIKCRGDQEPRRCSARRFSSSGPPHRRTIDRTGTVSSSLLQSHRSPVVLSLAATTFTRTSQY